MQIPVYQPYLCGNEKHYVIDCLDSSWISSKGKFITAFELALAKYIGAPHAIAVCNGTVALHLALLALDIQPGDEIIVPTFTYVASVNTIVQVGAKPIFVDSLEGTWQIDPEQVRAKITPKTRAVMAVHLYGQSCDMKALQALCKEHQLYLIEDCAEALGTYYHGEHVGNFGDIATFSFYGNKTLTTGEGGMVVARDPNLHVRAANLKNQGISNSLQYWHDQIGYNYRMTNICAAIGLAQLEQIDDILAKKRRIATWYNENLRDLPLKMHAESANTRHSFWMCSILLDDANHRDPLRSHLEAAKIETRPLFYPVHLFPMYKSIEKFPVAESLGSRGMNLPSWPGLTDGQLNQICTQIRGYFG